MCVYVVILKKRCMDTSVIQDDKGIYIKKEYKHHI